MFGTFWGGRSGLEHSLRVWTLELDCLGFNPGFSTFYSFHLGRKTLNLVLQFAHLESGDDSNGTHFIGLS